MSQSIPYSVLDKARTGRAPLCDKNAPLGPAAQGRASCLTPANATVPLKGVNQLLARPVNYSTLRRWAKSGTLPTLRIGGRIMTSPGAIAQAFSGAIEQVVPRRNGLTVEERMRRALG
jgi:hypothetical protein